MYLCQWYRLYQTLSKAEICAIDQHKYFLSEKAGYDVGLECAVQDWLSHHAKAWREERLGRDLAAQQREIRIHKWLESEKAGRDLGMEAIQDWIYRFAAPWRRWREQQEERPQTL